MDSLYEAVIYVAGSIDSLGSATPSSTDMTDEDVLAVKQLVSDAGFDQCRSDARDQSGLGPPAVPLLDAQPRCLLMASFEDQPNSSFPPEVIDRIHQMAESGQ